jgi:hypothetical protein
MLGIIRNSIRLLAEGWCHLMHPDPMWPVNGRYRCPVCYRTYPVPWANTGTGRCGIGGGGKIGNAAVSGTRMAPRRWGISAVH